MGAWKLVSLSKERGNRLRVFGNVVPRRIVGPKNGKMSGGYRKLYNEKLLDLKAYYSPYIL
jgi:hypothetical protein